jgi:hypothetical protein
MSGNLKQKNKTKNTHNNSNEHKLQLIIEWTLEPYLCCWLLHPFFCNTLLHFNAHFLIRNAVTSLYKDRGKRITECTACSLQLSVLKCTTRWNSKFNCTPFDAKKENENMRNSRSQFPIQYSVLARWKLNKKMSMAFCFQNATRIYRVPDDASFNVKIKWKRRSAAKWMTFGLVERICHRNQNCV